MRAMVLALALMSSGLPAAAELPGLSLLRPIARPVQAVAGMLRPAPRPDTGAPEVTRAAILPMLPVPASRAQLRPRLRPGFVTETLLASPRPVTRPATAQEQIVPAAIVRSAPVPDIATGGRTGKVCGDPAILGHTIPPIAAKAKGCGLDEGVSVISVAGVALTQPASIDCTTARALKTWVEDGVKPVVGKSGGGVAALQIAASYACRPRNNQKGAKISEHGRGRAIDISAIILADGSSVTVLKGWGTKAYGKTLAGMRKAACGPFNTVLGPGSDRHHADHFHLDTARGRGAYCR